MKLTNTVSGFLATSALLISQAVNLNFAQAEDLDAMFARVKDYVAAKNFSKALEEMNWVEKEIQKMNAGQVQTFFPDTLAGYTGGKFESTNALGFSNVERSYTKGSSTVKVSLAGGSGGAGLGQLAALGKMAAMFGGDSTNGTESVRIAGRTATIQTGSGTNDITVFLDSGSMLKVESSEAIDSATLRSVAEGIQIEALDNYLRGTGAAK